MEEKLHTGEEQIVSHFHEKDDTPIPQHLKGTRDYKETEKIFRLRDRVAFLSGLSTEDQLWKGIKARIRPAAGIQQWTKYAAIVILSFTVGGLTSYFSGIRVHEPTMASISSPRGQITSLKLFDGSTVWLNSETTIKYSSAFNTTSREVYVEGEAYFEVTRNKQIPFIVHLKTAQVKVHGTKFNVKAYPESDQVEAVLVEGAIGFTALHQTVMLKPDERVMLSLGEGTLAKDRINVEKTLAWKKGKYYYSNEKLPSIIRQLQRWYDVELIYNEEELKDYYFTGVINHEKSIRYNMELIELTNKVKVEFMGDQIIIKGR